LCICCCRVLRIELAECREEVRRREVEVAAWHQELNRIISEAYASSVFRDLTICEFFVVESCGLSWRSAGKK
jgi:hypothetical protein